MNFVVLTVYLDQNKWIDLLKAERGRPDGDRFATVLSAATQAVRENRARFPISFPHLHETAHAPRPARREGLARLMTELSQGLVLRNAQQVIEDGLRDAVRDAFGLDPRLHKLSPFGHGIRDAVSHVDEFLQEKGKEHLTMFLDTQAALLDLLSHSLEGARTATIASLGQIADRAASGFEADRKLLEDSDAGEITRVHCARATLHFEGALRTALAEIGRTVDDWAALGPDRLADFWLSIPSFRVQVALEMALQRNKSKPCTRNDLADLNALSLAIPCCDIVVTEKFWVHVTHSCKLNSEFHTVVFSDLAELASLLIPEDQS